MISRRRILEIMGNHQWVIVIIVFSLLALGDRVHGTRRALIQFVPGAIEKGAVCLDGISPPAYYFQPGTGSGANNWLVFLEGGAWCPTPEDCFYRATQMMYGNTVSRVTRAYMMDLLDDDPAINPDFHDWNIAFVAYCDGSSFMGHVEEVDPATNVTYRGSKIFDAVIDDLLARGMKNANNSILSGGSAGGLATMLNCDRFRSRLPNANRVKCISDAGFFIYGENLVGSEQRKQFYANVTKLHGMKKFLPKKCTSAMKPYMCLFPENLVNYIETPLLIVDSSFDAWQIEHNYLPFFGNVSDWQHCLLNASDCTPNELLKLQEFQRAYLDSLRKVKYSPSRGILVHNCLIHGTTPYAYMWNCPFLGGNTTVSSVVGDWYFDRKPINMIVQDNMPRNCNLISDYYQVLQQCLNKPPML